MFANTCQGFIYKSLTRASHICLALLKGRDLHEFVMMCGNDAPSISVTLYYSSYLDFCQQINVYHFNIKFNKYFMHTQR